MELESSCDIFCEILYFALSNINPKIMPKVSVDPNSDDLEKLTVPMLRARLARAGKSKGHSALKKKDIIRVLRGENVKIARKPKAVDLLHGLIDDVTPKRSSPAKSPKRGSPARKSPSRSSPSRSSPARKSPSRSSPAKSPSRSSPSRSSPKVAVKRIPPPPLPRDIPPPLPRDPIPAIVQGVASACATSNRKEAKRIIKCLCKKFPDIVRCAKKGAKVKKGEIGLPVFSPPRSPPKSPKPPSSPAPAPPIPSAPPAPVAVQHQKRVNLLHDIVLQANKLAKKEKLCAEGQRFSKKKSICVDRKVKSLETDNPFMKAIADRMGVKLTKSPKREAVRVSPNRSVAVASTKAHSPSIPVPVRTSIKRCNPPLKMNSQGKCSCPEGQGLSKEGVCVNLKALIEAGELDTFGNDTIKNALLLRRGKRDQEDEEEEW